MHGMERFRRSMVSAITQRQLGRIPQGRGVEMNESHFCGCDLYIHIKSLFEDGWTSCAKAKEEMLVLKDPSSTCER